MERAHRLTMENSKNAPVNNVVNNMRNIFGIQSFRFGYYLVHDHLNLVLDRLDLTTQK